MTWDELWTRGRQELGKRWDLALYRAGIPPVRAQLLKTVSEPSCFFFQPQDLPALVSLVRQRQPQQVEELASRAERICKHRFDLLGYEELDYGPEIDWHLDAVHNKRAPRKPWSKIRYLDFDQVGDSKIIWELNRHQHLVTLARAYCLTDNREFAEEIFRQWYHWRQENPYPIGINWASSLEIAFRSLSWLWIRHLLDGSPIIPHRFADDLLRALSISGRHIERYISTYFSPNTHLLGEGVGLFFIGTLCPQIPAAKRWQRRGWQIVLQESVRQVQPDGMHFEQSVYYHVYALDFFLHARTLAAANGIPIPPAFDLTLEKMLDLLCKVSQAGCAPQLGDDDGGRVFDPQRNRLQHMLDPLATGAAVFARADFKSRANLCEESFWLLGPRGIAGFDRLPSVQPAPSSAGFESAGIYVLAGSHGSQRAVIDAGPMGVSKAGHGHADTLSLCLAANGREWLVDAGTFVYVSGGNERNAFRGTAAHNTLQVDGANQAEPCKPFAWRYLPKVRVESWTPGENFDFLDASHTGYGRLPRPVQHRRCVFHLKCGFWLVMDFAEGHGSHDLELFWHLAPGVIPVENSPTCTRFAAPDKSALAMLTVEDSRWTKQLGEAWHSTVYGRKELSPVLRYRTSAKLPAAFVTLLHSAPAQTELGQLKKIPQTEAVGCVHGYSYSTPDEFHRFILGASGTGWEAGRCASDAAFLYYRTDRQDHLQHLIVCGGSFVEMDDRRIFAAQRPVAHCEWLREGSRNRVFCPDENAIEFLPGGSSPHAEAVLASDPGPDLREGDI